ncbi:MAG: hypothetical protein JRF33_05300 [Deltaproteobacteria bacterium]|nr:hypothetical protein [Deltaproteobacteria bacterium]
MPPKPPKPLRPIKPIKVPRPPRPLRPQKTPKPLKPQFGNQASELARETAKILRLKEEIGIRFWDLGQCLLRVHDRAIYAQAGFESFDQYLGRKGVSISRATAYRFMELARHFTRSMARKHSQAKLLASIKLAKATPEQDRPIDVLAYQIEVRDAKGKTQFKPFKDATGHEIKLAAQRINRRKANKPNWVTKPNLYPIPTWQKEAQRSLHAIAPKAALEIHTSHGTNPKVTLSLSDLPQSKLRQALIRLAQVVPKA